MKCRAVRRRFSAHRDGELPADETRAVSLHIGSCADCGASWREWTAALAELSGLPVAVCEESIAARIHTRLEVEMRGPGLSLLFRPARRARPLLLPSLVPAVLVLLVVLGAVAFVDQQADHLPPVYVRNMGQSWSGLPPFGSEGNPLFPSSMASLPRQRAGDPMLSQALESVGESTMFVNTVVGRDGRVSAVTLIEGVDSYQAQLILDLLRHQRYEPSRVKGRPVAVSFYRLISGTEVRAPIT